MAKYLKTKNGFLVDDTNELCPGIPLFIKAKSVEEIDSYNPYWLIRFIYSKKRIDAIKKLFERLAPNTPEEVAEMEPIYKRMCTAIDEETELAQEIANMEWEMSMACHHM